MNSFVRMCGICTWETPPQHAYDTAHSALWGHYHTAHPYTRTHAGKLRRKP